MKAEEQRRKGVKRAADSGFSMGKRKRLRRRLQLHRDGKLRVCDYVCLWVFFWSGNG